MRLIRADNRYHWVQIALHWLVVALVIVQYATGGSIGRTHAAIAQGREPDQWDLWLHAVHNRTGLTILSLMLARLALRQYLGVPSPLGSTETWRVRTAAWVHATLYAALILQASLGAVASYLYWPASAIHLLLGKLIIGLIAVHGLAALWHHVIRRDDTLKRMLGT